MENLEAVMEAACNDRVIPGAVLQAVNKSGSFSYSKAFGSTAVQGKPEKPLTTDAVMKIASCSKLLTSIAAVQCVERGQIGLDDDLANILPEIARHPIFTGFDDQGKPQLQPRKGTVTLRRLLTHSSGLSYPPFDPQIQQYIRAIDRMEIFTAGTVAGRYGQTPFIFEPGTQWMYAHGIDWAGQLVERLNNNISLEDYFKKNIWEPLGIKDITFFANKRPDMTERLAGMTDRTEDGKVVLSNSFHNDDLEDCFGGQGLYATMPDYIKILQSVLRNDGKLLKKETLEMATMPHTEKAAKESIDQLRVATPSIFESFIGEYSESQDLDYSLLCMVTTTDEPGWRGKGLLTWSGYPNLFWFVDPQNDICGIFGTQVCPPGDRAIAKLITLFEKTMHQRSKESK